MRSSPLFRGLLIGSMLCYTFAGRFTPAAAASSPENLPGESFGIIESVDQATQIVADTTGASKQKIAPFFVLNDEASITAFSLATMENGTPTGDLLPSGGVILHSTEKSAAFDIAYSAQMAANPNLPEMSLSIAVATVFTNSTSKDLVLLIVDNAAFDGMRLAMPMTSALPVGEVPLMVRFTTRGLPVLTGAVALMESLGVGPTSGTTWIVRMASGCGTPVDMLTNPTPCFETAMANYEACMCNQKAQLIGKATGCTVELALAAAVCAVAVTGLPAILCALALANVLICYMNMAREANKAIKACPEKLDLDIGYCRLREAATFNP